MDEKIVENLAEAELAIGVLVTTALAVLAGTAFVLASSATGGLALLACGFFASGFAGAAIGTGAYSIRTYCNDKKNGYNRDLNDYYSGLWTWGTRGFSVGAVVYTGWTLPPMALQAISVAVTGGSVTSIAVAKEVVLTIPAFLTNIAALMPMATVMLSEALDGDQNEPSGDEEGGYIEDGSGTLSGQMGRC